MCSSDLLKCGELNTPGVQEVVAILPAKYPHNQGKDVPIWKLVILRHEPSGWQTALTAARQIQNEAGYIGIDYIDDYFQFMGYQLGFREEDTGQQKTFGIMLTGIERTDGGSDQTSTEIAWNPAVGRYQELEYGQDPEGFQREIKNPPHWRPGVKLPSTPSR